MDQKIGKRRDRPVAGFTGGNYKIGVAKRKDGQAVTSNPVYVLIFNDDRHNHQRQTRSTTNYSIPPG